MYWNEWNQEYMKFTEVILSTFLCRLFHEDFSLSLGPDGSRQVMHCSEEWTVPLSEENLQETVCRQMQIN